MVISVADASTWLSICYQWVIENIYFIAFLTLYPQECSILPAYLKQTPAWHDGSMRDTIGNGKNDMRNSHTKNGHEGCHVHLPGS